MNIPNSISAMLAGIVLTLFSLWYGQNHGLLPTAASEEASLVDGLFNTMMTISIGLFLLVQGILIITAFRFRQQPGDETDAAPVHGNIPLEILWTAIPAVIVLGISVYSFDVYGQMGGLDPMDHSMSHAMTSQPMARMPGAAIAATLDPENRNQENRNQQQDEALQDPATVTDSGVPQRRDAPASGVTSPRIGATPDKQGLPSELVVNVLGLQYAWIFTYPDTGVTSGELHVPTGREVKLNISAQDVLHAFWVPQFRLKQDAVPGRQTELRFTPKVIGEYPVICAELCGAYHGAMNTKIFVEAPQDYDAWLQSQQVASIDADAVAVNPATLSDAQYLAPYAAEVNVSPESLHQLHHDHTHSMT